jgi:HPr kinase/phosphorylase
MRIYGSCAARDGQGVLLTGPAGAGKSDLVLRLLDRGFVLVADDQIDIADGFASAPAPLAGLLEVRGIGIVRLPYLASAKLRLKIRLHASSERLPEPELDPQLKLPVVSIDPAQSGAASRAALALSCAVGDVTQLCGAFA